MPALLDQDPGHVRGNAKADVDRIAIAQFLGYPPRDDLGDIELRRLERRQRPKDLARNGRFVSRMRRLQLIGRDHDIVDEYAGHDDVMGAQRTGGGKPFDLRHHNPAVVAHRKRLIERPENAPFMLVGKISSFVSRRCANDRYLRSDGREEQPVIAGEGDALHDRLRRRSCVHGAAFVDRIDERIHSHFGQHAWPLRRRLAMDVKQDSGRHVVSRDRVAGDHLPDCRRLGRRRARRIGTGQNAGEASRLREVVDALDAPHVARRDRMKGRHVPRMTFGLEPFSDRSQHGVGATERRRRGDGDDRAVGNEAGGV